MWFLWGVITFLIGIFSTSQLISFCFCFSRYPEMLKDMPSTNKKIVYGGFILHCAINLTWFILICAIHSIGQYWWACLVAAIAAIWIDIVSIKKDPSLKSSFEKTTGYADKQTKQYLSQKNKNDN